MVNTTYNQGSSWGKWDLHIHSPMSMLNNQFPKINDEPDWESYIKRLESLHDFDVLGITDYFTIEGYKAITAFREKGRISNIATILPNIEFRLDKIIASKKDGKKPRRINLHVIFSDDVAIKDIEENFLHNLEFVSEGTVQGTQIKEKLKVANLEELGEKIKAEFAEEYKNCTPLEVGAMNATVSLEQITTELNKTERFRGKYVVVLDEMFTNLIKWGEQDTNTRMTLLQSSDMVFSTSENTRQWCLGVKPYDHGKEQFIKTFKSLKPCIHGSDAHELFFIGHPCAKRGDKDHNCQKDQTDCELRYCWIKADPTFEGLKQVLYEPEDRICIQANNPSPSRHNYTLSSVKLSKTAINNELEIEETNLPLHRGLVCITGGRGAGKTAFVDLIANCFVDRRNSKDKNSFVGRISDQQSDLVINVSFIGEGVKDFSKRIDEAKTLREAEIAYISQGELEEYILENSRLTEQVTQLLFSTIKEADKYEFNNLQQAIENCEQQILAICQHIIQLEQKTTDDQKLSLETQKSRISANIKDLDRQIADIVEKSDDEQAISDAENAQKRLLKLRDNFQQLQDLKQHLRDAHNFLVQDVQDFNQAIESAIELLDSLGIQRDISVIEYPDAEAIEELLKEIEEILKKRLVEIDGEQDKLDLRQDQVAKHAKLLDTKSEEEKKLVKNGKQIAELNNLSSELNIKIEERAILYQNMLASILSLQNKYTEIINHFAVRLTGSSNTDATKGVLRDLEFSAQIQFEPDDFLTEAEDLFNNNRVRVRTEDSEFAALLSSFTDFTTDGQDRLETLAEKIESHVNDDDLRSKIKTNKSINADDFFRVFYRNYFKVKPIVRYKKTDLDRLSLGQKATVLIKIYLAQGNTPIIIDSHDDHLDNHFIMDELIPAVREAKKFRQVILVSNNANVVINTDAEQIIIAERNGTNISFQAGSLENPQIRNKALQVLEGGENAFKQRQMKYRLNNQNT